jgi:beta-carotene 15,15'-monooxygenase
MSNHSLGFHSLNEECTEVELTVKGDLPSWLSGSLIRNGPGRFEIAGEPVDHWFDGLAMLRKFHFQDREVTYTNRFLKTEAHQQAEEGESPPGFATGSTSMLAMLKAFLFGGSYDNASVIVERVGGHYLALTETPAWVAIDPENFDTLGRAEYEGPEPSGHLACAHLGRNPDGPLINFEIEFGRTSQYHIYEMTEPATRTPIVSIPVREPAYMHSFALTEHYVILTEFPFVIDPLSLLRPLKNGSFIDHFRWEPERGTRFLIIDREDREVLGEPTIDAVSGFHHINAFERAGDIVLDLETVPAAPESVAALYLEGLRAGELDVPAGSIERFEIADPTGNPSIDRTRMFDWGTALPTVSPTARCREYRYVYTQGLDPQATAWPRRVLKVDLENRTPTAYEATGYPSEPVFVPHPNGTAEDDGVVLTVVLDRDTECSRLVVLDGECLNELARAQLPHALPFDFHGRFFETK